jgi:hypothetical protein
MASNEGEEDRLRTRAGRSLAESLAPLAWRAYRLFWVGQSVSSGGDALMQIALVFAILRVGGTASDIGYIAAISTVSRAAFVLIGGVWADRLQRQMVMLTSDVARAGVQAVLAVLILAGHARVWQIGLGTALYGAAHAFFGPASAGLVPQMVPKEQLQRANALMSISGSFFSVCGPAAAGIGVAVFGPGVVFAIDAASFVVSAVSLGLLRLPLRPQPKRASFRADLAAGWHELAIRPWYWLNLIAHALWNFAIPAYFVLGPVIAIRSLGGASAWGAISAAFATGALAGGLIALRAHPRRPLVAGNLSLLLGMLPVLALAPPLATWAVAAAAALAGVGFVYINTIWASTMQALIPDEVRSRVNSYEWLISVVVMPAGMAIVGPLTVATGTASTLVGAALMMGIPSVIAVFIPGVRNVRRMPDGSITGPPLKQSDPETISEYVG